MKAIEMACEHRLHDRRRAHGLKDEAPTSNSKHTKRRQDENKKRTSEASRQREALAMKEMSEQDRQELRGALES